MRFGRETWLLGLMLVAFVAATALFARQSDKTAERKKPSAGNARPGGVRAYRDLLEKRGFQTVRLQSPLTELPVSAGLLVMVEPFSRPLQPAEIGALNKWLTGGGALLFVAETPPELNALMGGGFEEAAVKITSRTGSDTATIEAKSPYSHDVSSLKVNGPAAVTVKKSDKVQPIIRSGYETIGVTWPEKKGRVIYVTTALGITNERLADADNAVFFLNVAREHARGRRPQIVFDEYRQGYGYTKEVGATFWSALGPGIQAAAWYLLIGFVLLLITLNGRFGAMKQLPIVTYRPTTDYIASMAGLYQRSGAGMLALETILRDFNREISARLDTDPTAEPERVADTAQQRLGWEPVEFADTLRRCRDLVNLPGSMTREREQEVVRLAHRLQAYRAQLTGKMKTAPH